MYENRKEKYMVAIESMPAFVSPKTGTRATIHKITGPAGYPDFVKIVELPENHWLKNFGIDTFSLQVFDDGSKNLRALGKNVRISGTDNVRNFIATVAKAMKR